MVPLVEVPLAVGTAYSSSSCWEGPDRLSFGLGFQSRDGLHICESNTGLKCPKYPGHKLVCHAKREEAHAF